MAVSTLLVALLSCQQPGPQGAAARLDVLELKSGERLEGRIAVQIDGYVEMSLGEGATVGFSMAQVRAIHRGAGAEAGAPQRSPLLPRDEWFVLHDGNGAPVGWLHGSLTLVDGGVRLAEEWEFVQGDRRVAVTALETADAELRPLTCYWRERVGLADSPHVREERIVSASRTGAGLLVERVSGDGRAEYVLPASDEVLFPLLALERLRRGVLTAGAEAVEVPVFEPGEEEVVPRTLIAGRPRTVDLGSGPRQVVEVALQAPGGRSAEWLDSDARTVRREVNGPGLVAMPSDEATARQAAQSQIRFPAALATEVQGRFGVWLPNPAWSALEDPQPGRMSLSCKGREGRADLVFLDHLTAGASLEAAADAVQRWLLLLQPDLRLEGRVPARVRERAAVRILARSQALRAGRRVEVHVLACADGFLAVTCSAPAAAWPELEHDFAALVRSLELDPAALAARPQGPLARPEPAAQKPLPTIDLTGQAEAPLPLVRVPSGN